MSGSIVECVPNFSEGRDRRVLERITRSILSVPGIYLLGQESDPDHNRAVFSFAGHPDAVLRAAYRAVSTAVESIDLQQHEGVHPRIGSADVVPLVPVSGIDMNSVIDISKDLAQRIGEDLGTPVFLYARSASHPVRRELAEIRRGGLEGLAQRMSTDTDWSPDYGPPLPTPKSGAIVVGARPFLVAFNVNLDTTDLELARTIAREIRESSGGLPGVKALGLPLATRQQVQVSMNLTDLKKTGILEAFRAVTDRALSAGITGCEGELIGLVPREATLEIVKNELLLPSFDSSRILENRLADMAVADPYASLMPLLHAISSSSPSPGGGSAAAATAALSAAVAIKVARLTRNRKPESFPESSLESLESLRDRLLERSREDAIAYERLSDLWKHPPEDPSQSRNRLFESRKEEAARVPSRIASESVQVLKELLPLCEVAPRSLLPDVEIAAHLARSATHSARILACLSQTPYRASSTGESLRAEELLSSIQALLRERSQAKR
ncbi:MAG: glutamate formimidoyltransferase [Planctomycetota bacterium]|jgi:glutamate formiminotransferase|nr:glutamate formimidoyltransferase [Planctomycetota bacterium]